MVARRLAQQRDQVDPFEVGHDVVDDREIEAFFSRSRQRGHGAEKAFDVDFVALPQQCGQVGQAAAAVVDKEDPHLERQVKPFHIRQRRMWIASRALCAEFH